MVLFSESSLPELQRVDLFDFALEHLVQSLNLPRYQGGVVL